MNLQGAPIAPPGQEGWLRDQEKPRSHLSRADGVVVQTPLTALRSYCDFFLMPQPLLLARRGKALPVDSFKA